MGGGAAKLSEMQSHNNIMDMFFIQFTVPQLYWKFGFKRLLGISGVLEPFVVKDVFDVSF